MDDNYDSSSPPSLQQKLKNSLCFSCCFPHHHRPPPPPPPSSSDENPSLIWVNTQEQPNNLSNIKDKVLTVFNFVGNGNRHKRHSSTEFRYDPMSYSLNFEDGFDDDDDEAPLTNFSSRLPPSPPPVKLMSVKEVAAAT